MRRPPRQRVRRPRRPLRPFTEAGTRTPSIAPGFTAVPGSASPGRATPGYPTYVSPTPPVPPTPPVTGLLQSIAGTSYGEYGLHAVEISTTAGNGLVVYAGWDRNFTPTPAPTPAVYVSDSAGNRWYHLTTSDAGNSGARCSIWVCPNARATGSDGAPGWVSVSLTGFAASLAYLVCEFEGALPDLSVTDVAVTSSSETDNAGAITVSGEASVAGYGFSMACTGSAGTTLTTPPAGWDALITVSAGGSAADGVKIFPFVLPAVSPGAITAAYDVSGTPPIAAAIATIEASPAAPAQPNPNFPVLAVELGIGTLPGDVSAQPPVWTDITLQSLGTEDGQFIDVTYGREYELATPEAGEMTVGLNNLNGQFTPDNVTSPYWSNALSQNPGFVTTTLSGINRVVTGTAAGWEPLSNALLGVQSGYVYDNGWSASIIPDGATASTGLAAAAAAVGSRDYCASAWCYFPAAWAGGVQALIGWYSGASLLATTTGTATAVPAGTWTQVSVRASAFPGATSAVAYFQYAGASVPPSSLVSYWDVAGLCPGGQTVQTGLRDLTPVRVSAYWAGSWYDVASQYVQAWPVEFPDLPQYGLSKMKAADALAVMASCTLPSAEQGQILIDDPYTYLPCNEQYLTQTTGLTATTTTLTSFEFAEAQGLQAANLARFNQRSGTYVDGGNQQVQTGLALNLLGDQGTGMGTSAYSGTQGSGAGPGVIYTDPALPSPVTAAGANGVSAECWFVQDDDSAPTLLAAYANGSPFAPFALPPVATTPGLLGAAWVMQAGGTPPLNTIVVYFPFQILSAAYTASAAPQHVAVIFTPQSGGNWNAALWLNGQLAASATLSSARVLPWFALTLGGARYGYGQAPGKGNLVLGHAAVTACALSPSRIAAHYNTGLFGTVSGQAGDTPQQRIASILCWGTLGIPRGGPLTFHGATENVQIGAAYDVGGSSATDAVGVVTTSEGGLATTQANGYLMYLPRWWLYNLPSQVTFGDNSQGGEVPFERGQAFDLDTTYLYDQTSVTRVDGPTTSITATWRDIPAAARYFTRSALTQQIETTSDYDAYDASTWLTQKYKNPVLRVRQMTINAASNPAQAFPAVLPMRIGTVATVNRRPLGGAQVSTLVQTQKIGHRIGAASWKTTVQLSPYEPEGSVLQADNSPFDTLGSVQALGR